MSLTPDLEKYCLAWPCSREIRWTLTSLCSWVESEIWDVCVSLCFWALQRQCYPAEGMDRSDFKAMEAVNNIASLIHSAHVPTEGVTSWLWKVILLYNLSHSMRIHHTESMVPAPTTRVERPKGLHHSAFSKLTTEKKPKSRPWG